WRGPKGDGRFLAMANVGLFHTYGESPVVPDMMLALGIAPPREGITEKRNRSYFMWLTGKPPDAAVEIVSGLRGGEEDEKMVLYSRIGVPYYVIFDPLHALGYATLRAFKRSGLGYERIDPALLSGLELGLTLWECEYQRSLAMWLRWTGSDGRLIPTP